MAGVCAGLALGAAGAASAQSVDYGSLEQVFNEPVTTSATGSPQRSTEAPADMQIISADEIRRSGETSLPGILQRAAGIDVLNHSAGQSDVNVRGYDQVSSPRLLVLVNGRQVYEDHYGLTNWATIPVQLDEIRQIEVVKGPNSALFGFNAVSGVINIITYNPKFDDTNIAQVRAGDYGQRQGSMVKTFKFGDKISLRVSAGGESADEWKNHGPLPLSTDVHNPTDGKANADLVAQLGAKTDLRLEGSWSNVQEDTLVGYTYVVEKTATTSEKATLTSDTQIGLVQAQAYQTQMEVKYDFAPRILWNNVITVASLQDLFKIGAANTFRFAVEYRDNTLNTAPIGGGNVSYNVAAASGMWNWIITPQLTSTAAVRVDDLTLHRDGAFPAGIPLANNSFWDRTITEPSVNYTLAWRPTAADTFRASYARGVQAPSLVELGGLQFGVPVAPGVTFDLMGTPSLKPSIVVNYELAYDHDFTVAQFGLRLFEQQWTDIKSGPQTSILGIYPTLTTNGAFNFANVSDSKESGVEVSLKGKITPALHWRADYTYTDVKDSPYPGTNEALQYVAFQETTPKGRGNLGLAWEKGPWEADANLHYVGAYQWYDITNGALAPVAAYTGLSSRLGYRTKDGVTVAISGQNLLTDYQKQTRGLEAERRLQFTISKAW